MTRFFIEAYDENGLQILGNLDGQGVSNARNFRRTRQFKQLPTFRTLNNRVALYKIVRDDGHDHYPVQATVRNRTHPCWGDLT